MQAVGPVYPWPPHWSYWPTVPLPVAVVVALADVLVDVAFVVVVAFVLVAGFVVTVVIVVAGLELNEH